MYLETENIENGEDYIGINVLHQINTGAMGRLVVFFLEDLVHLFLIAHPI